MNSAYNLKKKCENNRILACLFLKLLYPKWRKTKNCNMTQILLCKVAAVVTDVEDILLPEEFEKFALFLDDI